MTDDSKISSTTSSHTSLIDWLTSIDFKLKSLLFPSIGGVLAWLVIVFLCGLIDIILFSFQFLDTFYHFLSIIGLCFTIAGAFLLTGLFFGFIFGQSQNTTNITSLTQVSDWLTKILVGVGLTQLTKVPDALKQYGEYIGPLLGNFQNSSLFGIGLLILFSSNGFLIGYLWTRHVVKNDPCCL